MRKKWIYRMGAVVMAGVLATSDMSAVMVLAKDGNGEEMTQTQLEREEMTQLKQKDPEVEEITESVSENDIGSSVDGDDSPNSISLDNSVSSGDMFSERDLAASRVLLGSSGGIEGTVYQIGGVDYDISEAEVSSEGTYCGIEWKLYDNGLLILSGEQTNDISFGNYYATPWRSMSGLKAVYLNFDTKGHSLERMFSNVGILGAACGSNFCMTGTRNISHMFSGCSKLTEFDFTGQDLFAVTTMEDIFRGCSDITRITFGEEIDTQNLENLYQAFLQCGNLTYLDAWNLDVGKVTTLYNTFHGCSALTELDLSGWDLRHVTNAQYAFQHCTDLCSLNIRDWKLPNLQNASCMFEGASSLTELDLSGWETSDELTNLYAMFRYCRGLKNVVFSEDMDTSGVVNMAEMFAECNGLEEVDLTMFSTGSCTSVASMFNGARKLIAVVFGEEFRLEKATTVERMFSGCSVLTGLDLSMWTGGKLTTMTSLFSGCSKLEQVEFGEIFDAGTVKKMTRMFDSCDSLKKVDLSNWQVEALEDFSYGFFGCDKLESVDMSGWRTENLTNMMSLFNCDSALKTVNLEGWNTETISSANWVFQYCSNLQTVVTPTENGAGNIALPKKMYDWDDGDREYSALPTGTSDSITLHSTRSCSYTVEISAALALEPVEEGTLRYAGDYDVKVSGYCHADGKCIAVFPESGTVVFTGEGGETVMGTVTQEIRYLSSNVEDVISGMTNETEMQKWIGLSEEGTEFTGKVSAEFEKPGNYSGTVNFRFGCYGYHFDTDGKTVLEE